MAEPPEPATLERLRGCLVSPFSEVVLHGLDAVAAQQDPTLARWVTPCLESPRAAVRRRAARVLGQLGVRGAAEALVLCLEDEDPGVALEAAWALEQVRPTDEIVSARRLRSAREHAEDGPSPAPSLAPPPRFEEAPPPVPAPSPPALEATPPARVSAPPAPAPAPPAPAATPPAPAPAHPAPPWTPATGVAAAPRSATAAGAVGPGTDLGALLTSLEESARRRAERAGSPRLELMLVTAFLGFLFGRYLPGMAEGAGPLPPPAGGMTPARAREVLFPGDGVLARMGRGASLVLEDDPRGVSLLDEAVTEYHFAPRAGREADSPGRFQLELESEGQPLGPPRSWRPHLGEGEGAARIPVGEPSPREVPAWAQGSRAPHEAPPALAEGHPSISSHSTQVEAMPSMVSRAEETLYKAAARRYLDAGDRQHAIELLETLTGRNFPGDELERYLSQP